MARQEQKIAGMEDQYRRKSSGREIDPQQQLWVNMFNHMYTQTSKVDTEKAEELARSYLEDEISWKVYLASGIDLCGDAMEPMSEARKAENQFLITCINAMQDKSG